MAASPYDAATYSPSERTALPLPPPTGAAAVRNTTPISSALPIKFYGSSGSPSAPNNGSLSGTVGELGPGLSRCFVRCYYRPTGQLIKTVLTAADGTFNVDGLDPTDTAGYFAVAFDPVGGTQYNALIFDRLTPV